MDRFTHQLYEFLQAAQPDTTLQQLIDHFDPSFLASTPVVRSDLFSRPASDVLLAEFFSGRRQKGLRIGQYPIEGVAKAGPTEQVLKSSSQQQQQQLPTRTWNRPPFSVSFEHRQQQEWTAATWPQSLLVVLTFVTLLLTLTAAALTTAVFPTLRKSYKQVRK